MSILIQVKKKETEQKRRRSAPKTKDTQTHTRQYFTQKDLYQFGIKEQMRQCRSGSVKI